MNIYKSFRICLTIFLFVFILGCTEQSKNKENKKEQTNIEIPNYKVLEKTEHLTMKMNKEEGFYMGSILIDDSIVSSKQDFAKIAIELAKKENMGQVYFYTNENCYKMNDGKIEWDDDIMNSCYLGKMDITQKGINWKKTISISDFQAYTNYWSAKLIN